MLLYRWKSISVPEHVPSSPRDGARHRSKGVTVSHSRMNLRISRGPVADTDCSRSAIRERLKFALARQTCRAVGLRTSTHPETVRRYLSDGRPSVEFLSAVAHEYGLSCDWLLSGNGPVFKNEIPDFVIHGAPLSRLLRAIAEKLSASEAAARAGGARPGYEEPVMPEPISRELGARDPSLQNVARRLFMSPGLQVNSTST